MPPPRANRKKKTLVGNLAKQTMAKKGCMKAFGRAMFSHVGLFLIVCLYAVGGAYILIGLERPFEESNKITKHYAYNDLRDAKNYIINLMWAEANINHTQIEYKEMAAKNLKLFHSFVVAKAQDGAIQYDGFNDTFSYNWDFKNSLLFTFTTMAAIGYGHITPKTFEGQMFTLFYGIIGVPMLLVFLANIGELMASTFRYTYSRVCCRWCRARRKFSEVKKNQKMQKKAMRIENVGAETYMPTDEVNVPITMSLLLLGSFLMIGGMLFSWWEGWTMVSSIYFTFVTLTTIGFGDMVPGSSFGGDGLQAYFSIFVTCCFIIFGMALVSMCINLMQEQMLIKAKEIAESLGIGNDDDDPKEKYKANNIKKKRPELVMTTPEGKDGNKKLSLYNMEEGKKSGSNFTANSRDLKLSDINE